MPNCVKYCLFFIFTDRKQRSFRLDNIKIRLVTFDFFVRVN